MQSPSPRIPAQPEQLHAQLAPRGRRQRLDQKAHVGPGGIAACGGGPNEKTQVARRLGGQLHASPGARLYARDPTQNGRHARRAERLIQGPVLVGRRGRTDHDDLLEIHPGPGGSGRIKLPPPIHDHQRPPVPAGLAGRRQGQAPTAAPWPRRQPFDERASGEPSLGESGVQLRAASRNRLPSTTTGLGKAFQAFLKLGDEVEAACGEALGHHKVRYASILYICTVYESR